MDENQMKILAEMLLTAEKNRKPILPLPESDPGITGDAALIQPRIEGELAFILKEDLKGPGVTLADVIRCSEGVIPALEIIDSRIADWKIKLPDPVADNASSARIVLGGMIPPVFSLDLRTGGMVL